MPSFDAIVIGAGHNGLVCATRLAKAGRRVVVLEAGDGVGGAARTVEFAPGFRVSHVAHLLNMLDPRVAKALDLERHGLKLAARNVPSVALDRDGRHLALEGAFGERLSGDISSEDRAAWSALRQKLMRYAAVLGAAKADLPPRLGAGDWRDLSTLGKLGLAIRRLGKDDMREFLRLVLINVADVLEEDLTDDRLKGLVAFDAVLGTHLGPRSPNSLMTLYYRLSGEVGGVPGAQALPVDGMGAVSDALAASARAQGVEIRTRQRALAITVEDDRATGVTLATGEHLSAPVVVSAANPRTTLMELLGPRHLDTGFVRQLANIRMRGNAAKLHLALDGLPDFRGLDRALVAGRLVIAPSVDAVENAFNPAKYGEASPEPVMEIVIPSLADPALAPSGRHVLSAVVQYAPHDLKGGWSDEARGRYTDLCLSTLETYAPGIRKLVVASELLAPPDLEARYGLVGGHWHHGELGVDQLFMLRPVASAQRYETPLPGLFLAGAGSHPGGGVSGAPGYNAAGRIIAEGGRA